MADDVGNPAKPESNSQQAQPLYGEGAPNDKNWDEFAKAEEAILGQAYNLPDPDLIQLPKVEHPLSESEDLVGWLIMVNEQLDRLRLRKLIDESIPHPMGNSEEVENWVTLSERVCTWLAASIDPNLRRGITLRGGKIRWADEFIRQCRQHFISNVFRALSAAISKLFRTRLAEFDTVKEFIDSIKSQYRVINLLEGKLPPVYMMMHITSELSKIPVLGWLIDLKVSEMSAIKSMKHLTTYDADSMCRAIMDTVKLIGLDSGVGGSGMVRSQQRLLQAPKKKSLMKAPPKGKTIKQHVENWKNTPEQRSSKGNCTYCGLKNHGPRECRHLVPANRFPGWKPKPGLWLYMSVRDFQEQCHGTSRMATARSG